jgi:uncharacterized protein (TIGR01777 family)
MTTFDRTLLVPVPRQALHDWHMRDGAFERLGPPWQTMRPVRADPVANGSQRIFEVKKGGAWLRWVAEHRDVIAGEQFTDIQQQGPFKRWEHTHRFEALDETQSRLTDHIDYQLPLGVLGRAVAGRGIAGDIDRMFVFRHRATLGDLRQHGAYLDRSPLRVAVTGASGLLGRQLVAFLRTGGHDVLRFVRSEAEPAADEIRWSVEGGVRDLDRLENVDAVIHLAGANVAQRWDAAARKRILDSRVLGTRRIVDAVANAAGRCKVMICASAIGFYGDTGGKVVNEDARSGEGFLSEVCRAWEHEAQRAESFGCRTARMRIGVVLDPRGGALAKLLPVFNAGIGGRVGSGTQLLSWVGLDDVLGAMLTVLQDDSLAGAFNVTGPEPVAQHAFAATLGRVLSRPAFAPAPAAAIKLMYGAMGQETVLASTGARPARLLDAGYRFRAATLEETLRHCLGRGASSVSELPA